MKTNKQKIIIPITLITSLILLSLSAFAIPVGPTITMSANETSSNVGVGTLRADQGGNLITLLLNVSQQNFGWKAYVGNITGKLVLEDAANYSIYDWALATPNAEVYISRNGTVDWTSVNCSNQTIMETEDTALSKVSSNPDSINRTFNVTGKHKQFVVAGRTIANSTCPSIATFTNGTETHQTNGEANKFQEILLKDVANNNIYSTIAENDYNGFDNNTYDFQAIVPDDETSGLNTAYYFYVELG